MSMQRVAGEDREEGPQGQAPQRTRGPLGLVLVFGMFKLQVSVLGTCP